MTTYPINTSVPDPTHYPANDVGPMKDNFTNINAYLQVDHTNPSSVGAGQHKQVTFNAPLGSDPSTPTDNSAYLYTKIVNSNPALFFLNKLGPAVTASANGSVTLFGGIILKWGTYTGATGNVTFATAFPNNCFTVIMQSIGQNASTINDAVYVDNVSTSGFLATGTRRITLQSNSVRAYYLAIGN